MSETLRNKLLEVAKAVDHIEKGGTNQTQNYKYVEAAKVVSTIRTEFLKRGVLVIPSARNVQHFTQTNGKSFVTTVDLTYRFIDTESAAEIVVEWVGGGADIGGEKGLYKAYTGGLKYLLLNLFLIPTGDDPERDDTTEEGAEHKDASRAAAPEIPLDRARAILTKAQEVGFATVTQEGEAVTVTLTPVLKAKLAAVGVGTGKIAHLNVDQAEDVEAWLAQEATNA